MELVPIREYMHENEEFKIDDECTEIVEMSVEFYEKVGYHPPWICYFVMEEGKIIGSAAIKGKPINSTIEIAYGTMDGYRNRGVGTEICRLLVELSTRTDASVKITARTLPENKFSCRVLERNNFLCIDVANDPEDGDVLEWMHRDSL
ncbi:GNAT family N-acetyltransferase [Emticicia sp. TH156]|uniref:GNAT family N-acetyltransferase n=1 Tax=Emticicia sp. TH156 TaxID=2067454 RepID=UPI000C755F80|nr:GNAT family N-acetyltransferase [Emticicia sp. TH156]PLK45680.1 N-acetyltransferase [Emticicia sp. TH156]